MSTTATDILPSSVPKLLPTGLNWTAFYIHFQEAIEAKGFWDHFDGTSSISKLTLPVTGEQDALNQWLKYERSAAEGTFAQAELRTHFMDSKYPNKGNVCEF